MSKLYKGSIFLSFLFISLFSGINVFADGSKDLYPNGVSGGRAKLRSSTVSSASYPFPGLNAHYVYAKQGELITMASSEIGIGNAEIRLTKPSSAPSPLIVNYSGDVNNGRIPDRTGELAGPRLNGEGASKYVPIYYTAEVTGIYKVEFIAGGGAGNSNTNGRESIKADATWNTNGTNSALISAWDVSVFPSNTAGVNAIKGRVFANVLTLDINFTSTSTARGENFHGVFYVLTKDGYIYRVNNNGNNGYSFTFFVNNKGFIDSDDSPIYKSLNTTSISGANSILNQVQDPRLADTESGITQKMFYTLPATDLPLSAIGAVPGNETWLKNPRLKPEVTDLDVEGVDGTIGQVSNKGGFITFDANLAGRYKITIKSTKLPGDPLYFEPRIIEGNSKAGNNRVSWDGKDGDGIELPNGQVPVKLTISLQGAEVHFPYFDMEINPNGVILELLKEDLTVESDIVYWNDTGISPTSTGSSSDPTNASQYVLPNGTSSNINGHKWGEGTTSTSNTYGDNRSMDTWTFITGAEKQIDKDISVKIADLEVVSITPDVSIVKIGDSIEYTVVVRNNGPSDVEKAPFAFNAPSGFEVIAFTSTTTCGVEHDPAISDSTFTSKLDLPNGCQVSYVITVSPTATADYGSIEVDATIMRPNDVTDPDATSTITPTVPPTDPYVEIENNGLAGVSNNIKKNALGTLLGPLTAVKTIVGNPFSVKLGDVITYQITITNPNTGTAVDNVTVTDTVPAELKDIENITPTGTFVADTITWTGLSIPADGDLVLSFDATIREDLTAATTTLQNTAKVIDSNYPDNPIEPSVTVDVEITAFTLLKELVSINGDASTSSYNTVGDVLEYSITVSNIGNVKLYNFAVSDPLTGMVETIAELAPGAGEIFTTSYTIVQDDLNRGFVLNTVTATSEDPNGDPVDPEDPNDGNLTTPGIQDPSVSFSKADDASALSSPVAVDDKITYTFILTNMGNVTLHDISVTDAKITGTISWTVDGAVWNPSVGVLEVGKSAVGTVVYAVTQFDIDAGKVENQAFVSITPPTTDPANPPDPIEDIPSDDPKTSDPDDPTITPLPKSPSIELEKVGTYVDTNTDGLVNAGDQITYAFRVTNTGNVTLKDIMVTDTLITVIGGPINLAPLASDSTTFTGTFIITQADMDAGGVYNQATAEGEDPDGDKVTTTSKDPNPLDPTDPDHPGVDPNCTNCTITPLPKSPSIELEKTGTYADTNNDGVVNAGDEITYAFKVTNTGNVTVKDIMVTDTLITVIGGPINLAPSASDSTTFTGTYIITQADMDRGGVYNQATAEGEDPDGDKVTTTSKDPNPLDPTDPDHPGVDPNCTNCTITPLPKSPSIELEKTGTYVDTNTDGLVNAGDQITYAFRVTNTGNVTVKDIMVTDTLITVLGGPINLAPLASDSTTFTGSYIITQADMDAGGVYNQATAEGEDPDGDKVTTTSKDPNPLDPTDPDHPGVDPNCTNCTITPLPKSPSIELEKTGTYADTNNDGVVNAGDEITYAFKVRNTGNVTVTDIVVTDTLITVFGGPINLAPSASDSTTFTGTYIITQADMDRGGVYNQATAEGEDPDGDKVTTTSKDPNPLDPTDPDHPGVDPNCTNCTITPLPKSPSIELEKTGTYADTNNDGVVNAGDQITYAFKVTNTGNVTVKDIMVTDSLITVIGGPINLAPLASDSTTFTGSYIITQADMDAGGVYNQATAEGEDPDGDKVTTTSKDPNPLDPTDPDHPGVDPNCPDCTITPLPKDGKLNLIKSSVAGSYDKVGDVINYNLVLTNIGNVTIKDIVITDGNADAGSIIPSKIIELKVGASVSITAKHTITQTDLERGYVYNIAKATGKDPKGKDAETTSKDGNPTDPNAPIDPSCPDCTITPIEQDGKLKLTKSSVAGTYNKIGDVINYKLVLTNTGNVTIRDIIVKDDNADAGSITPSVIAELKVGESVNITAKHTIIQADLDQGYVYNIAKATGKDPKGKDVETSSKDGKPSDPNAPIDPNCPDCTITPIEQDGKLKLTKSSVAGTHNKIGDVINYNLVLTNTGNVTIRDIIVKDDNADVGSITPSVIAELKVGESVNITANHTIAQADLDQDYVYNIAKAAGKDPKGKDVETASKDENPIDPDAPIDPDCPDCTITPIERVGSMKLIKTAKPSTSFKVGGVIIYELVLTNTGNVTMTDIFIKDENADAGSLSPSRIDKLEPGESVVITARHTITQRDKEVGYVYNIAVANGKDPSGKEVEVTSKDSKPVEPGTPMDPNCPSCTITPIEEDELKIPNVFTPNGDGRNDTFVILGLEGYDNAELTIFNRWGNEVYRNKNYKNNWDGNGLNEGTYYYLIILKKDGKESVHKGWVLLKR